MEEGHVHQCTRDDCEHGGFPVRVIEAVCEIHGSLGPATLDDDWCCPNTELPVVRADCTRQRLEHWYTVVGIKLRPCEGRISLALEGVAEAAVSG